MAAAEPTTGGQSMPSTVTAGRAQTMSETVPSPSRAKLPAPAIEPTPRNAAPRTVIDRFAAPTSAAPAVPSITAVSSAFRVAEQRGCHPNRPAERSSPDADEISNFTRHG
jgi:hypothetical protein